MAIEGSDELDAEMDNIEEEKMEERVMNANKDEEEDMVDEKKLEELENILASKGVEEEQYARPVQYIPTKVCIYMIIAHVLLLANSCSIGFVKSPLLSKTHQPFFFLTGSLS